MTRKEALTDLLEKVMAGEFDIQPGEPHAPQFYPFMRHTEDAFGMHEAVGLPGLAWEAYQGSLDAALALHEAVLPGWFWCVKASSAVVGQSNDVPNVVSKDKIPARAWLIAIISALISQEGDQ